MKAIIINTFGDRSTLTATEVPRPDPGPDDILISVHAAGVNPVDWKIREGWLEDMLPHEFPIILGWDAAGTVAATGTNVAAFAPGDHVYAYCRKEVVKDGAYAEFVAVPESSVARKPEQLSFVEAAGVPLAALTAYQALFDAARLQDGETVLVHAAAGGVGSFAVQLASDRGATVVGTASAHNHDYLGRLGVDWPIDYTATDVPAAVKATYPAGVDVVLDCVGGAALKQSVKILKPRGRLISIVDPDTVAEFAEQGIDATFVFVRPDGDQLRTITEMIDAGRLGVHIQQTYPLAEAARAHEQIETHHTRGKLILEIRQPT